MILTGSSGNESEVHELEICLVAEEAMYEQEEMICIEQHYFVCNSSFGL